MTVSNVIQTDFSSGELSPKIHGRFGLKLYQRGLELCENFIVEPQGPARFRTGTRFVNHTRLNRVANLVNFQFNDEQAYILEFTALKMRVFKDEGAVLESNVTISGATQANPVVITATGHGYSDGDEVYISSVVGMEELNGNYYLVANKTANTFELTDIDGSNIDGTSYTAYSSGGTSGKVFELDTPYLEEELFEFDHDQNADTITITHRKHDIRNITRTDHDSWTISTFSRTNDPFPSQTITGITKANPGVVTATSHGFSDGDIVTIQEVGGMTEVNSGTYIVANKTVNTFELTDTNGANVDTSGFTTYTSGGKVGDYPNAVGYYEGRRFYGGTFSLPETFWGTRGPDSNTGLSRYDDHTTGTNDDDAVSFTIAPSFEGTVNAIEWLAGMHTFLAVGTFGGVNKVAGNGLDNPITPTSINVKPITDVGSAAISPIPKGNTIIYMQRGKLKIRSLEFDVLTEGFTPIDRNFVADHISKTGFKQMSFQDGKPDILWVVLDNGEFAGLTFKTSEDVSGWHRHIIGGTDVNVISVGSMSLPNSFDQVWIVVERTIDGNTRRYVEFFEDDPLMPIRSDFITGDANKSTDDITFDNAMFESQKGYIHVDSALSYDGTTLGSNAGATLTPASSAEATGVTFTASTNVFAATDVGRELWKKSINGVGDGRAIITSYTDAQNVDCTITKAFDNTNAIPAGDWYITTNSVSGLDHLEGETVSIITDGAEHPSGVVIAGGVASLNFQASVAHVGLGYIGRFQTLNIESGAITGPGQTKHGRIEKVNPRFLNTARARFGTDFYNMKELVFRRTSSTTNRPEPLFTGIPHEPVLFADTWENEKKLVVEQQHPLPCIVQFLDTYMEVADE